MYNPEQKQIILKNSFGVSYHVFYESGRGICVRMLGDGGIWSRGYVLSELSIHDFSVILDKNDIFHFVFQSKDGRILYGHGRNGQIEIQPILNSKDKTPWMKHVSLVIHGNRVLFFYIINYQNRFLLSMQTIKEDIPTKPIAIDYVDGPGKNYHVLVDSQEKCHLFYTNNESSVKRLYHRTFNENTCIFNAPDKIAVSEHEILFSGAICIDKQIHFIYQVSSENSFQVVYRQLGTEKTDECLYKGNSAPGYTGLVYYCETLWFFRICSNSIYVRTSDDQGKHWTDEALYPFGTGNMLVCFIYFSNDVKELNMLSCYEIPGNFSRGYQLAFLNRNAYSGYLKKTAQEVNHIQMPGSLDKREHPDSVGKSEKNIRKNTEYPEIKELQKKIMLLHNLTENMQRELTKLWLTQKGHEKKLELLGRSYAHLKNNQSYIDNDGIDENTITETTEEDTGIVQKLAIEDEPFETDGVDFPSA
ncbi:MAG: hypothetical protein GX144_08840 [Clostridiaceae bacterium]|nr:hypothetical protein [Clostridiaceae bacterium]